MLEYFYRITPRERAIVVVAVLVALAIGLHALLVEPYLQRVDELETAIEQQRADFDWMRSAVADLPTGEVATDAVAIEGTLANFINQAVSKQGLSPRLAQMSPIGNDEVRMRYQAVDFNRLVGFIAQVSASGLQIKDLRISAADSPGTVDSSLIFVRP